MTTFESGTATFRGRVLAAGDIDEVFPLFSPCGEKLWVPGWNPELLRPAEPAWEAGQVFRTREDTGEAVWVVARLDRTRHEVEYYRVEPGRYVAHITVSCRSVSGGKTEVSTTYGFVGLSGSGNRDIEAMTRRDYGEKMSRWTGWINRHLAERKEGAGA